MGVVFVDGNFGELFEGLDFENGEFRGLLAPPDQAAEHVEVGVSVEGVFRAGFRIVEVRREGGLFLVLDFPEEDEALSVFDSLGGEVFPRRRVDGDEGEGGIFEVGHGGRPKRETARNRGGRRFALVYAREEA